MMRALILGLLLLLPLPASAATLKLATWNLEWLTARPAGDPSLPADARPKRPADLARLRAYALALNADVVAFQEVDGPAIAAQVFPPSRYTIVITNDNVVQRVGFAIRRGIAFTRNPDLRALDPDPWAKFPLRSGADVTLHLPDGDLRLLAVHLKTGCWSGPIGRKAACRLLHEQIRPLRDWIAARAAEGVPFAILGDFNRRMQAHDALFRALEKAAPLTLTTEGYASPCWGGEEFIDHILLGGPARAWLRPDSLHVLVYRETGRAWREHLSDHCPVSVRLNEPG